MLRESSFLWCFSSNLCFFEVYSVLTFSKISSSINFPNDSTALFFSMEMYHSRCCLHLLWYSFKATSMSVDAHQRICAHCWCNCFKIAVSGGNGTSGLVFILRPHGMVLLRRQVRKFNTTKIRTLTVCEVELLLELWKRLYLGSM